MQKNDLLTLTVSGMSFEGLGIARQKTETGDFVVFIHNAIPGDEVSCRIVKVEKTYAYGIIDRLLTPSETRIDPDCSTFEKCGGCAMRNMDYGEELRVKREFVRSAVYRSGADVPEIAETVPSPKIEHYRNKVILPLSRAGKFGFYARASHRNIENGACRLQDAAFEKIISAAEAYVRENGVAPYDEESGKGLFRQLYLRIARGTGEICACAVINGKTLPNEAAFAEAMTKSGACSVYVNENTTRGNTVLGRNFRLLCGKERIEDTLCGLHFAVSPRAFYQINREQTENLYTHALTLAKITKEDTVLDLFCGIGTIALTAAKMGAGRVVGVEIIGEAIEDAKRNAAQNGIENAVFFAADAAQTTEVLQNTGVKPTVVTVDPPRKGLSDEALAAVVALQPSRVVYVSCNPETLARDIVRFSAAGYCASAVTPFDMFPRSCHVESVVLLVRRDG